MTRGRSNLLPDLGVRARTQATSRASLGRMPQQTRHQTRQPCGSWIGPCSGRFWSARRQTSPLHLGVRAVDTATTAARHRLALRLAPQPQTNWADFWSGLGATFRLHTQPQTIWTDFWIGLGATCCRNTRRWTTTTPHVRVSAVHMTATSAAPAESRHRLGRCILPHPQSNWTDFWMRLGATCCHNTRRWTTTTVATHAVRQRPCRSILQQPPPPHWLQ
mmetsp:Transcript_78301/g.253305  ORF Transcript_78301/g.253305 Transcript_78301/m.253305 type:complete len:219 (+) Transcript_78301:159-815(+)